MSAAGNLTETLRVRLDAATLRELEAHAAELDRPPSAVARGIIREHLRNLDGLKQHSRRVR